MTTELKNKIALVTGGSRNIGRQTAIALANKGADVVITYLKNADEANAVVKELELTGVRAACLQVDLTGTAGLERFVGDFKAILAQWQRDTFNILVNNAGVLRLATFDRVTEQDLEVNFLTNYKSVFFLTQKLAPIIADHGRIINLGSGTARIAFAPLISYRPFKAAIHALTLYLASFLGPRGITVNAVAPGGLDDDFNAGLFKQLPPAKDFIKANTAMGRLGLPTDIGGVIAFLATEQASFVSGAVINIDGGYHL